MDEKEETRVEEAAKSGVVKADAARFLGFEDLVVEEGKKNS